MTEKINDKYNLFIFKETFSKKENDIKYWAKFKMKKNNETAK